MTDFWKDSPALSAMLERVSAFAAEWASSTNPDIAGAVEGVLGGEGKLLRPALLLISASFGKRDLEDMIPLAAAVELLHVSTLLHDDVIDDSPLRRGLPTAHSRFGRKHAVLAGDWLLSRCLLLAAERTSAENAPRLARAMSAICLMEIEQDTQRWTATVSVRDYLRKIVGKTALLFSLACHAGASESKAPLRKAESLRRAGYSIGMAFQIIDDILDYEGNETSLRKPVGGDFRSGLSTLPLVCALRRDDGRLAALLGEGREGFVTASKERAPEILRAVTELGGVEEARVYAGRYTQRALKEIAKLPAGNARAELEGLTKRLLTRRY